MVPKFKTVFLGETAVGKSSICSRLTRNKFNEFNESTIGASFIPYHNEKAYLEIWDTAGQERYRSLAPLYYRGAKACIMVYDVTDRLSFRKLRDWMAAIYHQNEDPLVLLLGNKVDCVNRRVVSKEEGEQYAAMIGALYFETSAKTGEGIELASDKMIEQLIMRKKEENEDTDDCPIKIENSKSFSLTRKLNTNCCS